MTKLYETLIVGQGLSGSTLAWQLLQMNKDFIIVSKDTTNNATSVSAGIANPIAGKKLNLVWLHDTLFKYSFDFFKEAESNLNEDICIDKNIYRIFNSEKQKEAFEKKKNTLEFKNYIVDEINPKNLINNINSSLGGFINKGFSIKLNLFQNSIKDKLCANNLLIEKEFNIDDVKENNNYLEWDNKKFKNIIFCEGAPGSHSNLFEPLKFRPAKGELLELKIDSLSNEYIINFGKFLLPLGNNTFKLGSTYEWDSIDNTPTKEGKKELLDSYSQYCTADYSITNHTAGVRPIIEGRKPIIGKVASSNFYVLNGLGSKGVFHTPYLCNMLLEYIFDNKEIIDDVNLSTRIL